MAKRVRARSQLISKLSKIKTSEVAKLSRLSSAASTSKRFGEVFKVNPAAALATKGIVIDEIEAKRITNTIAGLSPRPGGNQAKTEIAVSVKVKF